MLVAHQLDLASLLCSRFFLYILNAISAPARRNEHPKALVALLCDQVSELVTKR